MQAAFRASGWGVFSGSVYVTAFSEQVLVSLSQDGVALSVSNGVSLSAGEYYLDREASKLYVHCVGSVAPDSVFLTAKVKLFFSNVSISVPWDLSSGFEVPFLPLFNGDSTFSVQISTTRNLLGVALSSGSSLSFENDRSFWAPIFDNYTFETQEIEVYSWNRQLPLSDAALLYRGKIQGKDWSDSTVRFGTTDSLDELRAPVGLSDLSTLSGALVDNSFSTAKQRRVYGRLPGHLLTPIDQVTPEGYLLSGTVSVSPGATTVTGVGTDFLAKLSPGDDLFIGDYELKVRVDSVASDSSLELGEAFAGSNQSVVTYRVVPQTPKRFANREYLVAGHALARPSTTISASLDATSFYYNDTDFPVEEGDVIEINGAQAVVRVLGLGFMKLVQALPSTPGDGDTLYLASVGNVYLEDRKLSLTRDYSYNAATARLTLTSTAEFNVAPIQSIVGTITITDTSRTVTGSGTTFKDDFRSGDWIRGASNDGWLEVLIVVDDEELTLRTAATTSDAVSGAAGEKKNPDIASDRTNLAADVLGKTDDSGNLIQFPGAIAKDLLQDAGLGSQIVDASFDAIDSLVPVRLAFAIPAKVKDKSVPSLRDSINLVCRSSFTVVVLDEDFNLEMRQVSPEYELLKDIGKGDVIAISVKVNSNDVVSKSRVLYSSKEFDADAQDTSNSVEQVSSAAYLIDTEKEFEITTAVVDLEYAEVMASRWSFLQERATSDFSIETAMQGARYKIGDVVRVEYDSLYQRFGSNQPILLGLVSGVQKTINGTKFTLNDLGNSFSRVCRITENDAEDFLDSSQVEIARNGFITDANGITEGVPGIGLIW